MYGCGGVCSGVKGYGWETQAYVAKREIMRQRFAAGTARRGPYGFGHEWRVEEWIVPQR